MMEGKCLRRATCLQQMFPRHWPSCLNAQVLCHVVHKVLTRGATANILSSAASKGAELALTRSLSSALIKKGATVGQPLANLH